MKVIVVEGESDALILRNLFPDIGRNNIAIKVANGFSNILAIAKTLIDYGCDVLLIMDTDSNVPGINNRESFQHLCDTPLVGRFPNIVWMDPYIEAVISKANLQFVLHKKISSKNLSIIVEHRNRICQLSEFMQINEFIQR